MAFYRKKPVVIEAIQYDGTVGSIEELRDFCGESIIMDSSWCPYIPTRPAIETLEGRMLVSLNDFVIKGINGEFYPCKPDIFEKTYERVEE